MMLCKNCKYYNQDADKLEKGTGRCIVFPPVIVDAKTGCCYPVVSEDSFCMYFAHTNTPEITRVPGQVKEQDVRISPVVRRKR
jgi:hypothetical protein